MSRTSIVDLLKGRDRRSIGRSNKAAALASEHPRAFGQLISALWDADPVVRMRAADAAEKVSARKPDSLGPYKGSLLALMEETKQIELRWHLAQMVPRLKLTPTERQRAVLAMQSYLSDKSSIVRTFAMQALADFAERDGSLRPVVLDTIRRATKSGTPAMQARGRKLLAKLETA